MKVKALVVVLTVTGLAAVVWFLPRHRPADDAHDVVVRADVLVKAEPLKVQGKSGTLPLRPRRPPVAPGVTRKSGGTNEAEIMRFKVRSLPTGPRPVPAPAPPLSTAGRELCRKISAGYEASDFAAVQALVPAAMAAKEKAVREEMVWALDWFGEKALPEIVGFLSDPDDEVAQDAFGAWESALAEIEDEKRRLHVIECVLRIGAPKEMLESAALEYVGMDDRAAVESLVRIIDGHAPGEPQARERYEAITGEPYTTSSAAREWVEEFAM